MKSTTTTTATTVNKEVKQEVLSLSKQSKKDVDNVKSFLKGITDYSQEFSVSEMIEHVNLATSDLTQIELHLNKVDELITLYIDDSIIKSSLVKLQNDLKDKKVLITKFKNDSLATNKVLELADLKDKKHYLNLRSFNDWKTPITKYNNKLYQVKGFSANCLVFLYFNSQILQVVIKPLDFKSKKQSEHFQLLCKENESTVRKAVKSWLGKVTKAYELDSIITVQQAIEKEEYRAKMEASGEKLLINLFK